MADEEVRTIPESKLLKVGTGLTADQVQKFFSATPPSKIKERPAKGGGKWKYVSGSYVTQVLNSLFGFYWNFTVDTTMAEALATAKTGTVVVKGKLSVRIPPTDARIGSDVWIVKEQYGRKDVVYKKNTQDPLDFGNDLKAAATDAKKKCAAELGLFADVYSQDDFFEATVVPDREGGDPSDAEAKIKAAKSVDDVKAVMAGLDTAMQLQVAEAAELRVKELSGNE